MNPMLYLSREDVEKVDLSMSKIIDALETMFKEKGEGRVEMPPKPGVHTLPDAFIHAMPAYIPSLKSVGMKWVSGYPENRKKNLPYISGLIILNDPETGLPLSVMDATWITGKRTGAATAVGAKYLARPESESAGIIACGVQGRSNLEALAKVFSLKYAKAFDIHPERAQKYAADMSAELGFEVEAVDHPQKAMADMDLVVTSGPILKNPSPIIEAGWLKAGAFASPVDFDSYWQTEALAQIDKLATDDHAQMQYYRSVGYFKDTPQPYADLGEIVAGKKPVRQNDTERTMSMNLGLALDDIATAILIYEKAKSMGIGVELPL